MEKRQKDGDQTHNRQKNKLQRPRYFPHKVSRTIMLDNGWEKSTERIYIVEAERFHKMN